ncbi:hypothetical protein Tco_0789903 [Tanacetum coccineum]
MKQELWTLTLKGDDIKAYNNRFHELSLMCLDLVTPKKKKIERYIRGLPERVKVNVTSSKPTSLHDAINMARELVEQAVQAKATRDNQREIKEPQLRVGATLGIYHGAIGQCTSTQKKKLAQHRTSVRREGTQPNDELIDLLPTRLGSFDVIVGMDWLSYHRAVIVCYEKIVRILLSNGEILEIQVERPEKDPKSTSSIKADEKKLEDITIVHDLSKVFPDDLSGLPSVRDIEFRIDLIQGRCQMIKFAISLAPIQNVRVVEPS